MLLWLILVRKIMLNLLTESYLYTGTLSFSRSSSLSEKVQEFLFHLRDWQNLPSLLVFFEASEAACEVNVRITYILDGFMC